jgi:hypothetical protein
MSYLFKEIVEQVKSGEKDPLIAYAEVKQMLKEFTEVAKEIEPFALEEAEKYGKSFDYYQFKFERRNGAARYSYKHIPQWQQCENERKLIEEQSKAALKHTVISEDGEVVEPPKVSYSKDSLIVK